MADNKFNITPCPSSGYCGSLVRQSVALLDQPRPQVIKLLVTYFLSGDTYTEVVDQRTECMTPDKVAEWISADGFKFSKAELTAIAKACCDRLAGYKEVGDGC